MKETLLGLIFLLFSGTCLAQIQTGSYVGMMHLVPRTIGLDSVPVQLDIIQLNDTDYQLVLTYDSKLKKDYRLTILEDVLYLDENNGIVLPGTRIANTFIFHYAVNEQQYHVNYVFVDSETIHFKLSYFTPSNSVVSDDFKIQGYSHAGHQYVRLKKIE